MTRRAGYGKRVEQAMGDLLGVFRGKRIDITPSPKDPLPVGVAARLALLVAATDPAVLTGGMRRGSPDDQKARRESLTKAAVGDVPDVMQHVGLSVRCGGKLHAVILRTDDSLLLPRHPGLDPATERVAAALAAPLLPCVRELDGAARSWAPPVADDGPRSDPISVGELLAFVLTCRSWLRRGYALAEAAGAVEQGIAYGAVLHHLAWGSAWSSRSTGRSCRRPMRSAGRTSAFARTTRGCGCRKDGRWVRPRR